MNNFLHWTYIVVQLANAVLASPAAGTLIPAPIAVAVAGGVSLAQYLLHKFGNGSAAAAETKMPEVKR